MSVRNAARVLVRREPEQRERVLAHVRVHVEHDLRRRPRQPREALQRHEHLVPDTADLEHRRAIERPLDDLTSEPADHGPDPTTGPAS
jgi:hypothetical protein